MFPKWIQSILLGKAWHSTATGPGTECWLPHSSSSHRKQKGRREGKRKGERQRQEEHKNAGSAVRLWNLNTLPQWGTSLSNTPPLKVLWPFKQCHHLGIKCSNMKPWGTFLIWTTTATHPLTKVTPAFFQGSITDPHLSFGGVSFSWKF